MPHEVIMPALGMTQDTGLIIAWRKAPGDKVTPGEILMEVETDKATMEVEAQAGGYLADVRAAEGEAVPVGDVVALIADEKPQAQAAPKPAGVPEALAESGSQKAPATAANTRQPAPSRPAAQQVSRPAAATAPIESSARSNDAPASNGRILVSPKARRLANEQGLDLSRLAANGQRQPFHVADLVGLAALPSAETAKGAAHDRIAARVSKAGFDDFLSWYAAETGGPAKPHTILSAFAAAALRAAGGAPDGPLLVAAETPGQHGVIYADPDLAGFAAIEPADDGAPCLVVRDLSASRITAMRFAADPVPVLTVASDGDDFALALEMPAGALDPTASIGLITHLAARLEEPLRHLL